MIEVDVNGTIVEFPDETPKAVMQAALQKKFGVVDPAQVPIGTTGQQDIGQLTAAGLGLAQGAGAGYAPQAAGVLAAAGTPVHAGVLTAPATALKGGAKLLYDYLTGGSPEATAAYGQTRDYLKEQTNTAREQYPKTFLGSEIGGAIASPASRAVPLAQGAGWGGRALNAGANAAIYGGIQGSSEGETLPEQARNAAVGSFIGGAAGLVGTPAAEIAGKGVKAVGKYAHDLLGSPFSTAAQYLNPEKVGNKAIAGTIANAERTGDKTAISMAEYQRRLAAGEPVSLMDVGGDAARNLARTVKNEPAAMEGRQALQEQTNERFLGQGSRFANDVRIVSNQNRRVSTEDLLDSVAPSNSANYRAAHNQATAVTKADIQANGEKAQGLLTKGMRDLLQTETAQKALGAAAKMEHDRTIIEGVLKGQTQRGRQFPLEIEKTDAGGVRVKIREKENSKSIFDLHAADAVSRVLRDVQTNAVSSGDREFARQVTILRKAWLQEVDKQVPLYGKARNEAMKAFKVRGFGDDIENSYQAGQAYVEKMGLGGRLGQNELNKLEKIINQMSPDEKELFRRGAGERLSYKLEQVPENQDIVPKILASPVAVRQMEVAFGQPAVRRMIARRDLEKIMDFGRKAVMGNSTTALQQNLRAAGLGALSGAGIGGGSSLFNNNDPIKSGAATASVLSALAFGNRQIKMQVSAKVLDHVGKMLASGSPAQLDQAMQIVSRNEKLFNAVRQIAHNLERSGAGTAGGEAAPQIAPRVPLMIGRAGEEDQPVR